MRFPLKDWIDEHPGCRHNLAESGMHGAVRAVPASRRRFDRTVLGELRGRLGRYLGVDEGRVFLTHGATEANAWVVVYLARHRAAGGRTARVRLPEYPPLVDLLGRTGFRRSPGAGETSLAAVSRPRNPEGDLWPLRQLDRWADGAHDLLVDETFREFSGEPSLARRGRPGLWTTGTFTKFFGADHLRVGFAVAPPEETDGFGRWMGLVTDELPPSSAEGAVRVLEELGRFRREVRAVVGSNLAHLRKLDPDAPRPVAPVYFDRAFPDGDRLARSCLGASVLVCPGRFFGDAAGVRVCLTRRSFARDLRAYLAVRQRLGSRAA